MLIWTNFHSFAITLRHKLVASKLLFSIEAVLNSSQIKKSLKLVFRSLFLWNF